MSKKKIIFEKVYDGFEAIYDLERDISEMFDEHPDIPGDFQGRITVTAIYEEDDEDESS